MAEIVERAKSATAKDIARRVFRYENTPLIIVLAAVIGGMGVATGGLTLSRINATNVLLQASFWGVAAVGQAFVILTGGIDISVGGMGLFASMLGACMMTGIPESNIVGYPVAVFIVIPVILLVATGFGVSNGLLVSRVGMPALVTTLGMWEITKGLAFHVSRGRSIFRLPGELAFWGQGDVAGIPVPAIIFVVVVVVGYFVLYHTAFGRSVYAVGGNPVSAWLSGIKVKRTQLTVFVISGFLAGLASLLTMGRVMACTMHAMMGVEISSIAAVCIGGISLMGGRGSLIGALIGILILAFINNGMSVMGASPAVQGIVRGMIIIIAVAIDYLRRRRG